MNAIVEAALFYHRRGWVPVRVAYRDKLPTAGDGWQKLRPTHSTIATWGRCNVGVLLGAASGGLTDIDLDSPEAMALAPYYLPPTWVFGRAGKPRSHWLYVCHGVRTRIFQGLFEVRSNASTGDGSQTVLPPSIHVSGESIEWDPDYCDGTDGPREISHDELMVCVAKLGRGCVFMQEGATVEEARAKVAAYKKPAPSPKPQPRKFRTPSDVEDRARRYLAKMDASVSGSFGHRALFLAAVAMVRGFELDHATALALLHSDFNPRCSPPWDDRDLERKVCVEADKATEFPLGYLLNADRKRA